MSAASNLTLTLQMWSGRLSGRSDIKTKFSALDQDFYSNRAQLGLTACTYNSSAQRGAGVPSSWPSHDLQLHFSFCEEFPQRFKNYQTHKRAPQNRPERKIKCGVQTPWCNTEPSIGQKVQSGSEQPNIWFHLLSQKLERLLISLNRKNKRDSFTVSWDLRLQENMTRPEESMDLLSAMSRTKRPLQSISCFFFGLFSSSSNRSWTQTVWSSVVQASFKYDL